MTLQTQLDSTLDLWRGYWNPSRLDQRASWWLTPMGVKPKAWYTTLKIPVISSPSVTGYYLQELNILGGRTWACRAYILVNVIGSRRNSTIWESTIGQSFRGPPRASWIMVAFYFQISLEMVETKRYSLEVVSHRSCCVKTIRCDKPFTHSKVGQEVRVSC